MNIIQDNKCEMNKLTQIQKDNIFLQLNDNC